VTDENDLMIINKSGILIRLKVADVRVMGRATQGVRLINLAKKNDTIASVCKVISQEDEEEVVDEEASREEIFEQPAVDFADDFDSENAQPNDDEANDDEPNEE
jgi:DNA gyrase subunit A